MEYSKLRGLKLTGKAREIRDALSAKQERQLLEVSARTFRETMNLLNAQACVRDEHVLGAIMSCLRAGPSESEWSRFVQSLQVEQKGWDTSWLKAARKMCGSLIEAESREKEERSNPPKWNVVGGSIGFDQQRQYLLDGLKTIHQQRTGGRLFRHGSEIVRVSVVPENDESRIDILDLNQFAAELYDIPFKTERGENTFVEVAPPMDVVKSVYFGDRSDLPIPYLQALNRFPTFGERGQLSQVEGYNRDARTFYVAPRDLEVPVVGRWTNSAARTEDVRKASRLIVEELLADFPFDGWSRSRIMASLDGTSNEALPASSLNAMGLLLVPFVRPMIGGPVPGHLISKPAAGTGATQLAMAIQGVVTGQPSARPPLAKSEEERRKALFTAAMQGEPLLVFDNQSGVVDSAALAAFLTSPNIVDRILG